MSTTIIQNETLSNLLNDLQLNDYIPSQNLQALVNAESRFIKDLKINVGNALNNTQHLTRKEALMLAFAVAVNEKFDALKEALLKLLQEEGANEAEIAEIVAATSLMNTNNVLYRFRHFMNKEEYNNTPAGIKMSIMMNPVLGKEFFELLSLVISSINGCEMCVSSHERSVLQHGSSESRIFEAVKTGAIIKGLIAVLS
jgi:alkyl hydroperoxide reductase subunit D